MCLLGWRAEGWERWVGGNLGTLKDATGSEIGAGTQNSSYKSLLNHVALLYLKIIYNKGIYIDEAG